MTANSLATPAVNRRNGTRMQHRNGTRTPPALAGEFRWNTYTQTGATPTHYDHNASNKHRPSSALRRLNSLTPSRKKQVAGAGEEQTLTAKQASIQASATCHPVNTGCMQGKSAWSGLKIWGSHRSVTENSGLLKCDGESLAGWFTAAGRNAVPSSSSSRNDEGSYRGRPEGGVRSTGEKLSVCDESCTLTGGSMAKFG